LQAPHFRQGKTPVSERFSVFLCSDFPARTLDDAAPTRLPAVHTRFKSIQIRHRPKIVQIAYVVVFVLSYAGFCRCFFRCEKFLIFSFFVLLDNLKFSSDSLEKTLI
jgi:hypothetical protein